MDVSLAHQCFSPSSPSLPLSLKIQNKIFFKKKKNLPLGFTMSFAAVVDTLN